MDYLLYIIYTLLFCWLISRMSFFRNSGLEIRLLIILFIVRVCISLVHGYLSMFFFEDSDTKYIYMLSVDQLQMFLHSPGKFFAEIFVDPYKDHHSGLFGVENSYWNNLRLVILIKVFGLLNLISGADYYVNTLIFNFPVFLGTVAFFRFFDKLFPNRRRMLIFFLFIFPTSLYFTSVPHKDGAVFLALGFIFYYFNKIMSGKPSLKYILSITGFLILIFFLRNFVVMALLPALVAWGLSIKKPKYSLSIFMLIYGMTILIFFASEPLTGFSFPQIVVERQQAFIDLTVLANSALPTAPLQPNFTSFLQLAPMAIYHVLLKPLPTDILNLQYIPFVLEVLCFECLLLLYVLFPKKSPKRPFFFFMVSFSMTMLLSIGYTIPILGAIVRYRTYYLLLLMVLLALHIHWNKIPFIKNIEFLRNI